MCSVIATCNALRFGAKSSVFCFVFASQCANKRTRESQIPKLPDEKYAKVNRQRERNKNKAKNSSKLIFIFAHFVCCHFGKNSNYKWNNLLPGFVETKYDLRGKSD